MTKIPQRNVNLANKMNRVARYALVAAEVLSRPGDDSSSAIENAQEVFLDGIAAIRDFRRKTTPIELKGQRG